MKRVIDTSVLVAAFASWHADHRLAASELSAKPSVTAHSMVELFSVLTRLPEPQRAEPRLVADFIDRNFHHEPLTLTSAQSKSVLHDLVRFGISGGAAYDGLIAMTVLAHDARLISLDRRAEATYRRCGVQFELLH